MDLNLRNNTALITASSSGIGLAIAKVFLKEGSNVVFNGRDPEKINYIVTKSKAKFKDRFIAGFAGDLSTEIGIFSLKTFLCESKLETVDHLILNLGTGKRYDDNLSIAEWRRFFEINLFGAVELLNCLLNIVTSSVIFISSLAGIEAINAPYAYSASKLAILSLAKQLSVDYARKGIRINTVIPGNIYFDGGRWSEIIAEDPAIVDNYIKKETPLGRFGKPEEIANTVVFLCSEKSSYTTGTSIIIDGGQSKGIR
jgi:3-oxoacyl-[acyl-carrier protein] reductase